jgi:hypothetical protein
MRRTAIALTLVALVAGMYACTADAPTAPPGGGGGTSSSAIQIQLVTGDANPKAGTCTLVQAIVTLNGNPVPDGTGVAFSTDLGFFGETGLPTVSIVTTGGAASTGLCSSFVGTAKLKATVTIAGKTGSATLSVVFQSDSAALPFVSSCNPSFGSTQGGETLTINGGRFFGSPSTTRIQFTANGISHEGIVTGVTASTITAQTPAFPELTAPTTLTAITLTLGTYLPTPVVLSLPSCFAYGTASATTPTITAILPSSGTNEGNTRVTIVGSGFSTASGVQVFFGTVEASVVSVSFSQVVVLSPPAFGAGAGNLNQTVQVTVRNIGSGTVSNGVDFRYTPAVQITAVSNGTQRTDAPFTPVTIYGQGFQAPVAVTLAGVPAYVQSVAATELVVLPGNPLVTGCANVTGEVSVTNINTGDTATGSSFTYIVPQPSITSLSTSVGQAGDSITITGTGFPLTVADAEVKFGSRTAFVTSVSVGSLTVTVPPGSVTTAPTCDPANTPGDLQVVQTVDVQVTNRATTCVATATAAFSYELPCVAPTPTPGP